MTGLIVWCMMDVVLDYCDTDCIVQTAVKCQIKNENNVNYLLDCREYCNKQGYGNCKTEFVFLNKDLCMKDKK